MGLQKVYKMESLSIWELNEIQSMLFGNEYWVRALNKNKKEELPSKIALIISRKTNIELAKVEAVLNTLKSEGFN